VTATRVAALLTVLTAAALTGSGSAAAADAPPAPPRALVVALGLQSPALQAGVVRGRDVILARGFEVELARILARRLGGRVERFVYVPSSARLLASGAPGWHLALAGIEPGVTGRAAADLSVPYLTTDVAVVARPGLERPRRLADLRDRVLCAVRGSRTAHVAARVRPSRTELAPGTDRLRELVRTGACDAALVAAVDAGGFVRGRAGTVAGRAERGQGFVVAVPRGTGLDSAVVDRELRRLRRDGTLGRLARTWLGLDPAALRILR
jgi:ABC-type amino acid transport substrate-binding protein